MVTYEVSGVDRENKELLKKLQRVGTVQRLDSSTVNLTVPDEDADDASDWLDYEKPQYRMV